MQHMTAPPTSRRNFLVQLLLSASAAPLLGWGQVGSTLAAKPGKNTIATVKHRIQTQRDNCELLGNGELEVRKANGGKTTFTYCEGGKDNGTSCRHTDQSTTCHCEITDKPGSCSSQTATAPDEGGVITPGDVLAASTTARARGKRRR